MPRWEHGSEDRLKSAAIALFEEQGFENTSVVEIARRARVTTRTFFRYFPDKKEVLFAGADDLRVALVDQIIQAPNVTEPLKLVVEVLARFDWEQLGSRDTQRRRRAVIAASPELLERDLIKNRQVGVEMADALRRRGVEGLTADLAAHVGIEIFYAAYALWIEGDGKNGLPAISDEVLLRLATIMPTKSPHRILAEAS